MAINTESVDTRRQFASSTSANFPLLSDPTGSTVRLYGALGENGLARRVTVLIGPDGRVQAVDESVSATIRGDGAKRTSLYAGELELLLSDWKATVGSRVPRFFVPDSEGRSISPRRGDERASLLLVVDGPNASSAGALREMVSLDQQYRNRNVTLMALATVKESNRPPVLPQTGSLKIGFDLSGGITMRLGVQSSPWAVLLDANGTVLYSGVWDDNRGGRKQPLVAELLQMHLAGRKLPALPLSGPSTR